MGYFISASSRRRFSSAFSFSFCSLKSFFLSSRSFLSLSSLSALKFVCSERFVLFRRFTIVLIRLATWILRTSLSLWKPTWPTSIPCVFFKFDHIVYTTSISFILFPSMLFAFTNCAASSNTVLGMSSIVWPCNYEETEQLNLYHFLVPEQGNF